MPILPQKDDYEVPEFWFVAGALIGFGVALATIGERAGLGDKIALLVGFPIMGLVIGMLAGGLLCGIFPSLRKR